MGFPIKNPYFPTKSMSQNVSAPSLRGTALRDPAPAEWEETLQPMVPPGLKHQNHGIWGVNYDIYIYLYAAYLYLSISIYMYLYLSSIYLSLYIYILMYELVYKYDSTNMTLEATGNLWKIYL
jgi:hypothetical protein